MYTYMYLYMRLPIHCTCILSTILQVRTIDSYCTCKKCFFMYTVYVVPLSVAKCLSIISLSLMMGLISSLTPFTPSMWYLFNTSLSDPSSALLSKTRMSVNSRAYTSGKEDEKGHTCELIHFNYVSNYCVSYMYMYMYIHIHVHVYVYTCTYTHTLCMHC